MATSSVRQLARRAAALSGLLAPAVAGAQPLLEAVLLSDIEAGQATAESRPMAFVAAGGRVFFSAESPTGGRELWLTDGTPAGTRQVRDIDPGRASSNPQPLLATDDGRLLLRAGDAASGGELWISDGTSEGTVRLSDAAPGAASGVALLSGPFPSITGVGQGLYVFPAADSAGSELWVTDLTPGGTVRLADLNPGATGSSPAGFVADGSGTAVFRATGPQGARLWRTDGTPGGTLSLPDVVPTLPLSQPLGALAGSAFLFAGAPTGSSNTELWRLDAGAAAATLVAEINPSGAAGSAPTGFVSLGARVVFSANDGAAGSEPWVSDGTAVGTFRLADATPGAAGSAPASFVRAGGFVFFVAATPGAERELWATDGTPAGTRLVSDIRPGTGSSNIRGLAAVNDRVFFAADDGTGANVELWVSDGTTAGTNRVIDLAPGEHAGVNASSRPFGAALDGVLIYSGRDVQFRPNFEPARSDGTAGGTRIIADLWSATREANPDSFLATPEGLYFGAGWSNRKLWVTDGTPGGTRLVRELNPNATANPVPLTWSPGRLLVAADLPDIGREPVVIGPAPEYAATPVDLRIGPSGSEPRTFGAAAEGPALFTADDGLRGREIWRSDASPRGPEMLADINPVGSGAPPVGGAPVAIGDRLLFGAYSDPRFGGLGVELYAARDGQVSLVRDINPGQGDSFPSSLTALAGRVYFRATSGDTGTELWSTDGTLEGTGLAADIAPGAASSVPANLVVAGDLLYFQAGAGEDSEVWWFDPSTGQASRVADVNPGPRGSAPAWLTPFHNGVFGVAHAHDASGPALYYFVAGEGARLVFDPEGNAPSEGPSDLLVANGRLYFAAGSASLGRELWQSNATPATTHLVSDINPGDRSSFPERLLQLGDRLVFTAFHFLYAPEPTSVSTTTLRGEVFAIDLPPTPCNAADIVGIGGFPPPDGELTVDDYTSFINAFAADEPLADIVSIGGFPPPDGELTVDDYTSFINAFALGCE